MIQYTYSTEYPSIQRLQGGILVPVDIEQVEVEGEDGSERQYRYQLLKFEDHGEDITDDAGFWEQHKDAIDRYLADGVDVQRDSAKAVGWSERFSNFERVRAHVDLRQDVAKDVPVRKQHNKTTG